MVLFVGVPLFSILLLRLPAVRGRLLFIRLLFTNPFPVGLLVFCRLDRCLIWIRLLFVAFESLVVRSDGFECRKINGSIVHPIITRESRSVR
jgi:hypothetical protein